MAIFASSTVSRIWCYDQIKTSFKLMILYLMKLSDIDFDVRCQASGDGENRFEHGDELRLPAAPRVFGDAGFWYRTQKKTFLFK